MPSSLERYFRLIQPELCKMLGSKNRERERELLLKKYATNVFIFSRSSGLTLDILYQLLNYGLNAGCLLL